MSREQFAARVADPKCDLCDEIAVIHYVAAANKELLYCNKHRLEPQIRRRTRNAVVKRRRFLPFENGLSKKLALPKESPEHRAFKWEMCEGQLIGGDGAVRYYFSVISGRDQFVAWEDQFVHDVTQYVTERTSEDAVQFIDDTISPHWVDCLTGFFQRDYERNQGIQTKTTKRVRAVELLLTHPDWTDDEIAESVPTTIRQLQRNPDFTGLRAVPRRRANANMT